MGEAVQIDENEMRMHGRIVQEGITFGYSCALDWKTFLDVGRKQEVLRDRELMIDKWKQRAKEVAGEDIEICSRNCP